MPTIDELTKRIADLEAAIHKIQTRAWRVHQAASFMEVQLDTQDRLQRDTDSALAEVTVIIDLTNDVRPPDWEPDWGRG